MIDLSYKPKKEPRQAEPEEVVMGAIAVILWIVIVIGWIGAC